MNGLWGIVLVSVAVASIGGALYLIWSIGKFPGIKKLCRNRRILKFAVPALILAAGFGICALTMSPINAVIVLIHLVLFRLLFGIAGLIIKRIRKKDSSFYWQGWGSLAVCILFMATGFFLCNHVFVTSYDITTEKKIGNLKAVMFADSHIGVTFDGESFARQIEEINKENPDIVFIAGDFVDDGTKKEDMLKACEALGKLNARYGVWYVYGNHDKGYNRGSYRGYSASDLEFYLRLNHVHVMEDDVAEVAEGIVVAGRADASNRGRMSIEKLTAGIDEDKYVIVLDHQPNDYENEAGSKADLVLSGHTHGGQFIPFTIFGIPPNDMTYGYERKNGTDFIVTSGISDWELVFKTGTKSEYVVLNISGKN